MHTDLTAAEFNVLNTMRRVSRNRLPNQVNSKTIDKKELSELAQIAYPTCVSAMAKLDQCGYLSQGRIAENFEFFLGFSLGKSSIIVVMLDYTFQPFVNEEIHEIFRKLNGVDIYLNGVLSGMCIFMPEQFNEFIGFVNETVMQFASSNLHLVGIGMAFSGIVDNRNNIVRYSTNRCWLNNLTETIIFTQKTEDMIAARNIAVVFEHNSKATVIAEKEMSSDFGETNIASLYLGTGIGVGYVMNNQLLRGKRNGSGQIGHMKLTAPIAFGKEDVYYKGGKVEEYGRCSCGQFGCFEQLIRSHVFGIDKDSNAGYELTNLKEGQKKLLAQYMGLLLANMLNNFSLDAIVISGRFIDIYDDIYMFIMETLRENCYGGIETRCHIRTTKMGNLSTAIGAAIAAYFKHNNCDVQW